jgi:pimeloyl-ACP methyl ester carboxylesterase
MRRAEWVKGGRFLKVDGQRVFFRVEGAGPTLVFIHGFPTSSIDWEPVIASLSARFRCVSFDLLGFGASSKPLREYRYADQLRVLDAVVEATQSTDSTLIAHDYGVTVAQLALARKRDGPWRGVMFLNGGLNPALHRARPIQKLMASWLGPLLAPWVTTRKSLERSLSQVLVRRDRLDFDDAWEAMVDQGGIPVVPRLLRYIEERRSMAAVLTGSLTGASVPLSFAWGKDDPVSGAHMLDWVRAQVPQATVFALEGVGHYPQLEAADEVAGFIASWAGNLPARR